MKILEAIAATIHAIPEALAGRASLLQYRLELDEAERTIAALGFHEPGRCLADDIRELGVAWQDELMRGVRLERELADRKRILP